MGRGRQVREKEHGKIEREAGRQAREQHEQRWLVHGRPGQGLGLLQLGRSQQQGRQRGCGGWREQLEPQG